MSKWLNSDYLHTGNSKQRLCFEIITELNMLDILANFDPIVVGTIPIEIDIDSSDLDIICNANDLHQFRTIVTRHFKLSEGFEDKINESHYVAHFYHRELEIEIFAEDKPSIQQNAYRHMRVEDRILRLADSGFRQEIIKLKTGGLKTEPAFGKLLHMKDSYSELLVLENLSDTDLIAFINNKTLSK